MEDMHKHTTHPDLVKRLKRAEGHLRHVIGMIEGEKPASTSPASSRRWKAR